MSPCSWTALTSKDPVNSRPRLELAATVTNNRVVSRADAYHARDGRKNCIISSLNRASNERASKQSLVKQTSGKARYAALLRWNGSFVGRTGVEAKAMSAVFFILLTGNFSHLEPSLFGG